jgi:hypothetical protein
MSLTDTGVSLVTFLPQPFWLLMLAAPRSEITRKVMGSIGPVVGLSAIHLAIVLSAATAPGGMEPITIFADVFDPAKSQLDGMQRLFAVRDFVAEEWPHVLIWDLLAGRAIWLDCLARGVSPMAPSLLLCNLIGPPGLLLHCAISLATGKGLPALGGGDAASCSIAQDPQQAAATTAKRPRRGGSPRMSAASEVGATSMSTSASCASVLSRLFGGGGAVDAEAVAAACSSDVEWDDLSAGAPVHGRDAVRELLAAKYPPKARVVLERLSDGRASGGFTFHREEVTPDGSVSEQGLRGTLFATLNDEGQLGYVREGSEPILKPGEATEMLLKAATSSMELPPKPTPTFTPKVPTRASEIVRYLWEEAYPNGADPSEALRLFSETIVYEDFNYPSAFVGKPAVSEFVQAFDLPGVDFVPLRVSEGDRGCAFTWLVKVNGQDGPQGISFYELDDHGKVCYIRDIPAPSPRGFRPLGYLADLSDPELRILRPKKLLRFGLGLASLGMGLLQPLFAAEARLQAQALGGEEALKAAQARLDADVESAPVVVYTYALSPFSTEALALLDARGCRYKKVELGLEWFLLGGDASALRAELLTRTGQSSLPHVFVGGESIGGLYSGTPGLAQLDRQGELVPLLKRVGAL